MILPGVEARDTSRRSVATHPSKFRLVEKVKTGAISYLSPSGQHAVRYSANDLLLISLAESRSRQNLQGHVRNIHDAGWSKNGKVMASSGYDGAVKLWDVSTGRELSSMAAHSGFA